MTDAAHSTPEALWRKSFVVVGRQEACSGHSAFAMSPAPLETLKHLRDFNTYSTFIPCKDCPGQPQMSSKQCRLLPSLLAARQMLKTPQTHRKMELDRSWNSTPYWPDSTVWESLCSLLVKNVISCLSGLCAPSATVTVGSFMRMALVYFNVWSPVGELFRKD